MDIKQPVRIKIESNNRDEMEMAVRLAEMLGLPNPSADVGDALFVLMYSDQRLELHVTGLSQAHRPLCLDFLSGSSLYRFQTNRTIHQPLCRAVGLKQGFRPVVLDATAGFGQDGFVLASLGCRVVMLERSPLIWALLDDALRRAGHHQVIGPIIRERITLHRADAIPVLNSGRFSADTIYLDPMYPAGKKSALNRGTMRQLACVVGNDSDTEELLTRARACRAGRVVVKRPAHAPQIGPDPPSFSIKQKSTRYDVFLQAHL